MPSEIVAENRCFHCTDTYLSLAGAKTPISTHRPPVTSSVWPVTYDASGDAKLLHPKSTGESLPIGRVKVKQTYKSIEAAASSAVPGRARGIVEKAFESVTPGIVRPFAPGIPRATFLPPISIVSPSSLAAVNLPTISSAGSSRKLKRPKMKRGRRDAHRVRMYPKAMVLARTPNTPHSRAMVLVKPTTADLAAA